MYAGQVVRFLFFQTESSPEDGKPTINVITGLAVQDGRAHDDA